MRMTELRRRGIFVAALMLGAGLVVATALADAPGQRLDQGAAWTEAARQQFYRASQGSQLIPLSWLRALTLADGTPFISSLTRYGFLPDSDLRAPAGLPVGFVLSSDPRGTMVGLGCAACHVREIAADGAAFRIDGAPATADVGAMMVELDAAVQRVLASDAVFTRFAQSVLGAGAGDTTAREILAADVRLWSTRFHALVAGALPRGDGWGPARYDMLGMAFDTLAGLSLGPPPTALVPGNIQPADAPVRAPILWNAGRQDRAFWTGIAGSGDAAQALTRDLAELQGTFGRSRPASTPGAFGPLDRDYLLHNSASFDGLAALDGLVARTGAPAWPWPVDRTLADKGRAIYELPTSQGGCVECHGEEPGAKDDRWKTPVVDAGTDRRAWRTLGRTVDTGTMAGASVPGRGAALKPRDAALDVLRIAVAGVLIDRKGEAALARPVSALISGVFVSPMPPPVLAEVPVENGYTARVLHGIWAAAPYLHDGSVPTLADLLEPAEQRPKSFAVGEAYDPVKIGLAAQQPPHSYVMRATGCEDVASGDSNCGHVYGTRLPKPEKRALLEYLKTL